MQRIHYAHDIQPLSAFVKKAEAFTREVQKTGRPVVLTRGGRSVAVLIGAGEFERMTRRLELLEDVQKARGQALRGETVSQDEAQDYLAAALDSDNPEAD